MGQTKTNGSEEDQGYAFNKIIGIQSVIDSASFQCQFYKKPIQIKYSELKKNFEKFKANPSLFTNKVAWGISSAVGKIDFIYCTTFKGKFNL